MTIGVVYRPPDRDLSLFNKISCNKHKPWITWALLKSINKNNKFYRVWIHKRTDYSLIKYKEYKNKLTSIIPAAEKLY